VRTVMLGMDVDPTLVAALLSGRVDEPRDQGSCTTDRARVSVRLD
jgi:hypothetical protein